MSHAGNVDPQSLYYYYLLFKLGNNDLGDCAVRLLTKADWPQLRWLILSILLFTITENCNLTNKSLTLLAAEIPWPLLQTLNLSIYLILN